MKQIAIAFDQLLNTLLLGYADETLSARSWRKSHESKLWKGLRVFIDALFFWESEHCYNSYISEIRRNQLPREYRK